MRRAVNPSYIIQANGDWAPLALAVEPENKLGGQWPTVRQGSLYSKAASTSSLNINVAQAVFERASLHEKILIRPDRDRLVKNVLLRAGPEDFELTDDGEFF